MSFPDKLFILATDYRVKVDCLESCQKGRVELHKKATIHQVTTMLTTSKNVLFPGHNCNICCPRDGAYFVSGRRTVFMYDVPNKRQSGYASQEQQTCSFHGVNSGIILEITPVVNS